MSKTVVWHENKLMTRYGNMQKKQIWMYVSAGLIVCSILAIWYVAFPDGVTLYDDKLPASDVISTLPLANSVDNTKAMRPEALVVETPIQGVALDLTLAGVIFSESGGLALISISGKPAQPYAKGAYVKPGYMIQTIESERVMLAEDMDKPVTSVLLLMKKSLVSTQSNTLEANSESIANSLTAYLVVQNPIPKKLESGPLPRADSRYRFIGGIRHQHGYAEGLP